MRERKEREGAREAGGTAFSSLSAISRAMAVSENVLLLLMLLMR